MATSTASRSTPRWEKTGETGTPFSGISRHGRGNRGRGGHRGGRGAGRGTPREPKSASEDNATAVKQEPSPPTINPSTTPSLQPPPTTISNHPSPSQSSSTKSKSSSRKPSRTLPSPINVEVTAPQIAPSPSSARTPNRRRRPQAGKSHENNPSKTPTSKDNHPKSSKSKSEPESSTLVRDTPRFQHRLDVRQGIDALVERVRAVAMDNRPTTPGSHIDWAGDDDDTLPDLNDWGVNTSTFTSTESESISPIIVEGLKPLPDITAPVVASPLRQVVTLDEKPNMDSSVPSVGDSSMLTPTTNGVTSMPTTNTPIVLKTTPESVPEVKKVETAEQPLPLKPSPSAKGEKSKPSASNRRPWHPSLPAKPTVTSSVPLNSRPVATPMRSSLHPKSAATKDTPPPKSTPNKDAPVQNISDVGLGTKSIDSAESVPLNVELLSIQEKSAKSPGKQNGEQSASTDQTNPQDAPSPLNGIVATDDGKNGEGLEASMHAPKAKVISTSAPAEILNYSLAQGPTIPRNHYWNHSKDQASGQFHPHPRSANGDHHFRSSRSGQWDGGRGGFHSPGHAHGRNHSAPNVGSPNSHQRPYASRPVITGDAISRIARTIGGKSNATA